jgi:transcriptional antiterminator RfaH
VNKFNSGWYLIYTMPRHEKKVHTRLTEMSIDTFLPTRKVLRAWHDRKKYIDEPLFPSYVFVYLNDLQNYYDGLNPEGSLYYVKAGKEIVRVNENVVNNIKLVATWSKDIEVSEQRFQPGQKLVINKGVLTGLSCEVVRVNSGKKLLVRVELLQRNLLLTLSAEQLQFG